MSNDTEWEWRQGDPPEALPYHLRKDAPPLCQCSECGRKSWTADSIDTACKMPQPYGVTCNGEMTSRVTA